MTFLDSRPTPEVEFAKEIEAAEKEFAQPSKEAEEPSIDAGGDTPEPEKAEPASRAEEPVKAEPAEKPEPKEDHRVPVSELQKERQRRQEAEERERKWQEWYQANQQFQPKEQPQPKEDPLATLDENSDPVALIAALKQEVLAQRQKAEERAYQEQAFNQQQAFARRLEVKTMGDIEKFQKEQPDYLQAVEFVRNTRLGVLAALGYSPDQAAEAIKQDSFNIALAAAQQGDNYAKRVYEIAKLHGYQQKKPEPAPTPSETVEDAIDLQAKRAAVATSLSTGGKKPSPEVSAQDATKLTGAAFDSWWAKNMEPRKRTAADFSR